MRVIYRENVFSQRFLFKPRKAGDGDTRERVKYASYVRRQKCWNFLCIVWNCNLWVRDGSLVV